MATLVIEHGTGPSTCRSEIDSSRMLRGDDKLVKEISLRNAMQIMRFVGSSAVAYVGEKDFLTAFKGRDYTRAVFWVNRITVTSILIFTLSP
jgi:hypothetical protein